MGDAEALGIESAGAGHWAITRRGERTEIEVIDERTRHIRSLTGAGDRPRGPAALKAPMPGLVVRVQVEAGQSVAAGAGVVVLEAMKMENELRAAAAGTVRTVRVSAGEAVEGAGPGGVRGDLLTHVQPAVYLVSLFRFDPISMTQGPGLATMKNGNRSLTHTCRSGCGLGAC